MEQVMFDTPENIQERARVRREADQARKDAVELVLSYAQDIVNAWPTMTIRTIAQMTLRVEGLKQAMDLLKNR